MRMITSFIILKRKRRIPSITNDKAGIAEVISLNCGTQGWPIRLQSAGQKRSFNSELS
jgi:hypothetical protein